MAIVGEEVNTTNLNGLDPLIDNKEITPITSIVNVYFIFGFTKVPVTPLAD